MSNPLSMIRSFLTLRRIRAMHPLDYAEHIRGTLHSMGEHCAISPHAVITDPYLLNIGNNVRLARCTIFGHDGAVNMINRMLGVSLDSVGPVKIGNNVFVGEGAIILPGTTIGNDVVIGAGAVVKGSVDGGHVYAGNPLRPVCTMADYVAKLHIRTAGYPWQYLLAGPRTPEVEAQLTQIRVRHFFDGGF